MTQEEFNKNIKNAPKIALNEIHHEMKTIIKFAEEHNIPIPKHIKKPKKLTLTDEDIHAMYETINIKQTNPHDIITIIKNEHYIEIKKFTEKNRKTAKKRRKKNTRRKRKSRIPTPRILQKEKIKTLKIKLKTK